MPVIHNTLGLLGEIAYNKNGRRIVIALTFIIFVIGGYYNRNLMVGDANPGTPILWPDSEYNRATASMNEKFTGTTLIAGVIFWYFLSSLRFQAEMGLLLAIWMFISMLGGMVLIPTVVAMVRPKFIARRRGPGSG